VFDAAVEAGVAAFLEGSRNRPTRRFLPAWSGLVSRSGWRCGCWCSCRWRSAAVRHEAERIGGRSWEMHAVDDALYAGQRMKHLRLEPTVMTAPLPPAQSGDGGVPSPRRMLEALLAGHGFTVTGGRTGTLQVDAQLITYPQQAEDIVMGQVDVVAQHPDLASPQLVESLAAAARTWHQVITECVDKSQRSVLHVLIAGLLDHTACAGEVSWEPFHHRGGEFDLCTGLLLWQRWGDGERPDLPGAFDRILGALEQMELTRKIHSLRIFTAHHDHQLTANEVLLDGQPWPSGETIVAQLTPPPTSDLITTRLFALLIPR
jgi:hypothetical protein